MDVSFHVAHDIRELLRLHCRKDIADHVQHICARRNWNAGWNAVSSLEIFKLTTVRSLTLE